VFRELLDDLLGLIGNGYFISGPDAGCDFCDFGPVCGGTPDAVKTKIEANTEIFEAYRRLKKYD
jgi:hypothetical protein